MEVDVVVVAAGRNWVENPPTSAEKCPMHCTEVTADGTVLSSATSHDLGKSKGISPTMICQTPGGQPDGISQASFAIPLSELQMFKRV